MIQIVVCRTCRSLLEFVVVARWPNNKPQEAYWWCGTCEAQRGYQWDGGKLDLDEVRRENLRGGKGTFEFFG